MLGEGNSDQIMLGAVAQFPLRTGDTLAHALYESGKRRLEGLAEDAGLATLPNYFLYRYNNKRTDEYGGSFENRCRFTRELLTRQPSPVSPERVGVKPNQ